jgi:hypothetical protein
MSSESSSSSSLSTSISKLPRLASATVGGKNSLAYAAWRPIVEASLLRLGLNTRDYATAIPNFVEAAKATEESEEAEDVEAINLLLSKSS